MISSHVGLAEPALMCAGAHNRSAAIEQTRKDRSEVDASRHKSALPLKFREGGSARPNGSSSKNPTPSPARLQFVRAICLSGGPST